MAERIIAMVPARKGSTRLKIKNLAMVNGRPMISYAIRAAVESGVFDKVVVNADHPKFEAIAERYGADFYLRPEKLGRSDTKSDDVVLDFMEKHPCDAAAWVNPTSPLQTADTVREVVQSFQEQALDGLITVEDKQVHCVFDGKPVNYSDQGKFAQTQDLRPVQPFVYSVMMWRTEPFRAAMARDGHAFFLGKMGYHPVDRYASIIVKTAEDLLLVDAIARGLELSGELQYDPLADEIIGG